MELAKQKDPVKVDKKNIPLGRTITTRDNYLGKSKTGSTKKRAALIVDKNKDGELGLVPMSGSKGKNRSKFKDLKYKESYYKHFIEIEDNEGNPITINEKFKENHKNMDVSLNEILDIRKHLTSSVKQAQTNKSKLEKLHKKSKD